MTDRELDALVAEKVMGIWPWLLHDEYEPKAMTCPETGIQTSPVRAFDRYSTDISAAWQVVERMQVDGSWYSISGPADGFPRYHAEILNGWKSLAEAEAETAPRAICLAALRALGVEVGK